MYSFVKEFFYNNKFYYFIFGITKLRGIIYNLVLPHFYGLLIANIKKDNIDSIKYFFIYLICFWLFAQFLSNISIYIEAIINPKFLGYIRTKIIKKLINNYKNNFKDIEIGRFITKIVNTPYLLQETISKISRFLSDTSIQVVSTFCYLFYYNNFIGLCFLVCILLFSFVTYIYYKSCSNIVYKSEKKYDDLHEYIEDTISNLLFIYSSNQSKNELKRYNKINQENEKLETQIELCILKFRIIYSIIIILYFIIINYFTFYLYIQKYYKLSTLISIIIINYSMLTTLMYLFYNIGSIIDSCGRLDVFYEYIEILNNNTLEIENNVISINKKINIKYTNDLFKEQFVKLEIKDLYFTINNKEILKNINITINKNENVLITGNIGSGKSTLAKLIFGLYSYNIGSIKINNIEKNKLDQDILKNYITYIPQHPKLFNRTLLENITYGLNNVSINNIYKILDELKLHELKKKYIDIMYQKTGKNGSNLSGGQRQIVWLIRAILRNNKMIILDEPTSSLDNNTKHKVLKLIKKLGKNKNIIIISHDKELYNIMDKIIYLKNGTISKIKNLDN